jgi:hypothetical protein
MFTNHRRARVSASRLTGEIWQNDEQQSYFSGGLEVQYQCLFEIGLCIAQEGGMAVPAVWRLINLLAFIEPKQHTEAHRRNACAPLPKSKSKLLLV